MRLCPIFAENLVSLANPSNLKNRVLDMLTEPRVSLLASFSLWGPTLSPGRKELGPALLIGDLPTPSAGFINQAAWNSTCFGCISH